MKVPRNVMVIDLDGMLSEAVRHRYPEVYQHLLERVKPERDRHSADKSGNHMIDLLW